MPACGQCWVPASTCVEPLGNLKKFWLAAMKCDDTLWLEELLGFRVEDRPFLPPCAPCDCSARTTDGPWVDITSCSQFLFPLQRHVSQDKAKSFPSRGSEVKAIGRCFNVGTRYQGGHKSQQDASHPFLTFLTKLLNQKDFKGVVEGQHS